MSISVQERPVLGKVHDFSPMRCRCADGSEALFNSGTFLHPAREGGGTLIFEGRPIDGGSVVMFGVPVGTRLTPKN